MNSSDKYFIGKSGQKWDSCEKQAWFEAQQIKRSYRQEVVSELEAIGAEFDLIQYGELDYSNKRYPLYILKSKNWNDKLENVLITGGVHGYETSGVHGAIQFAKLAPHSEYNFIIAPCVSPWGYETINRWNPKAIDPNRSFYENSPAQEASLLICYIDSLAIQFITHIDLHETTDTDNSEFRPALASRDAITDQKEWAIPDGFYLVADSEKPQPKFQKAIIEKVKTVTHIAPADEGQRLIGVELEQTGVINYDARKLGLCMGLTDATYVTTTEVYPDSPLVDDKNCIDAQVAVICGALEYLRS
ncbi:MAG: M14 family metallocarboxypeptidase [Psychromonas sp.]|nr:M14 family metallocarboxypeptidase [Psychromonas sp.]